MAKWLNLRTAVFTLIVAILIGVGIALWYMNFSPSVPTDWVGVKAHPIADAAATSANAAKEANAANAANLLVVPFCQVLEADGKVHPEPDCGAGSGATRNTRSGDEPRACGFQNRTGANWNSEIVHLIPSDVADQMADDMATQNCSVAVLDFEGVAGKDREAFTMWMRELVFRLKSLRSKSYAAIVVYAKADDLGTWEGTKSQDWAPLCTFADELMIMPAGGSSASSADPTFAAAASALGSPAPFESVLKYATSRCPSGKLRVGVQTAEQIALAKRAGVIKTFAWNQGEIPIMTNDSK